MARKRIRIDLEDQGGAKYNFNIEGNVTREKILKIFELMDLMNIEGQEATPQLDSVGGKIWNVVDKHFPIGVSMITFLRMSAQRFVLLP